MKRTLISIMRTLDKPFNGLIRFVDSLDDKMYDWAPLTQAVVVLSVSTLIFVCSPLIVLSLVNRMACLVLEN